MFKLSAGEGHPCERRIIRTGTPYENNDIKFWRNMRGKWNNVRKSLNQAERSLGRHDREAHAAVKIHGTLLEALLVREAPKLHELFLCVEVLSH